MRLSGPGDTTRGRRPRWRFRSSPGLRVLAHATTRSRVNREPKGRAGAWLRTCDGPGLLDLTMKPVPIHKAKASLSKLVERACAGEDVVIARGNRPMVRLVPVDRPIPHRKFGALRGKLVVDQTFFDSLPESELEGWE